MVSRNHISKRDSKDPQAHRSTMCKRGKTDIGQSACAARIPQRRYHHLLTSNEGRARLARCEWVPTTAQSQADPDEEISIDPSNVRWRDPGAMQWPRREEDEMDAHAAARRTPPLTCAPKRRPAGAMAPNPGVLALPRGRGGTSRRQQAERIRSARIRGEEIRLQSRRQWDAECIVVAFEVRVR